MQNYLMTVIEPFSGTVDKMAHSVNGTVLLCMT